jgi:hypothetical protein
MNEIEKKTGITDAECEEWDDYYTKNTFEPGPNLLKQGICPGFARTALLLSDLDPEAAEYLRTQAVATHRTQAQIIGELIRKELKAAV